MKFAIVALIGALTVDQVLAVRVSNMIEPFTVAQQEPVEAQVLAAPANPAAAAVAAAMAKKPAAAPAKKANAPEPVPVVAPVAPKGKQTPEEANADATKGLTEAQEEKITKAVVASEKPAELVEARNAVKAASAQDAVADKVEAAFKKEDAAAATKKQPRSVEEQKEALAVKMEALNKVNQQAEKERKSAEIAKNVKAAVEDDKRKKAEVEKGKAVVAAIEKETAAKNLAKESKRKQRAKTAWYRGLNGEEWTANMPEHVVNGEMIELDNLQNGIAVTEDELEQMAQMQDDHIDTYGFSQLDEDNINM